MTQKTVLIVEDEEDAAELFAEMMRVSGFHVLKTSTSTPALSMMTAEKPDVVILDIMMPEISGLDILRQMRRDPALANIPVVVVSATTMPVDIKSGMEAGALPCKAAGMGRVIVAVLPGANCNLFPEASFISTTTTPND